jgi:hypothetical protein
MINLHLIPKVFADEIIGTVENPLSGSYGDYNTPNGGIVGLFTNLLRLVFVVAGIYALFNFIMAGYQYMMAGGDAKMLNSAWARIWQTLMGLVIIVGSFALAALVSYLFFGDATFILNPKIWGPGV